MTISEARTGLKLIERQKDVEASLWRRLRYENRRACRETIFSRYHELARRIALGEYRRRPAYGLDRSDFEQLAYGGLLEAIDRFDPLRGVPFDAFARRRIRGAISDGLARSSESAAQYTQRRRLELERLRSINAEGSQAGLDPIVELSDIAIALAIGFIAEGATEQDHGSASSYGSLAWREMEIDVLREIELLPPNERSVLQQHYLKGVSFKHIAQMLGVSKGRVSQLHRAALTKLRARLRPSG